MRVLSIFLKFFKLVWRNMIRNRRRNLLTALAILTCTIALLFALGYVNNVKFGYREALIHFYSGHIQIHKEGYSSRERSSFEYTLTVEEQRAILSLLDDIPSIRLVHPVSYISGVVRSADRSLPFFGSIVNPDKVKEMAQGWGALVVEGTYLSLSSPYDIVIGTGMAESLGKKVGDHITLLTISAYGSLEAEIFRVSGFLSTGTAALDDSYLVIGQNVGTNFVLSENAHEMIVLLEDTEQTEGVLKQIQERIRESGIRARAISWEEVLIFYKQVIAMWNVIISILAIIMGIIVVLFISNIVYLNIVERTRELSIMRVLGTSRSRLFGLLLSEVLLVAFIGAILGVIITMFSAAIVNRAGFVLPPFPGQTTGTTFGVLLDYSLVLKVIVYNSLVALVSSVLPGIRLIKMRVIDGIKFV